jgi:DnaA-homolog protein
MKQLPLPVQLRASSVFASFYRGPNADVVEQLLDLSPAPRSPAVWLYGPIGAGKTHLLQAVCGRAGEQKLTAAYIPLADSVFTPSALTGCESLSFVCLDDFDRVVGQSAWERAVFRLYTELEDSGGRLLIAAMSTPAASGIALKDLESRLTAGAVLRLQPLSDEEQMSALSLRAAQLGMELTQEAAQFLIRRLPRDMTTLCAALDTLDRASLASQRRLTVPFVREVLGDSGV